MKTQLYAPEIDALTESIKWETAPINPDIYQKLTEVYSIFSYIKTIGDDELRETWLEVERGPIEAFGDYEEFKESGEVENRNDFEQLWKDYYPEAGLVLIRGKFAGVEILRIFHCMFYMRTGNGFSIWRDRVL